ncbi:MAG: IS21 family transposase [Bacteroidales bacterium]|nr:IS21 family transposase [Bacteroidales bacterium]
MEDYKKIRQMYLDGISQREIGRQLHLSRNTVAKYCKGCAVPWARKVPERETSILTDEVVAFIQACLDEDIRENLKKQRHTAKRIYDRLVDEKGFAGGESTVRRKVRELKGSNPQVFVPLEFSPGEAMQTDWGEATVYLRGKKVIINLFCARLCSSCAPIVFAYRRQNQESFLEAFVRTFRFFGGVPEKVIFDNAKVAVKDGFGAHAKKQAGYTALSAHYGFDALFCNPAEGHEKGLVEGLVGWSRRNILVPVPRVNSLEELNSSLKQRCLEYLSHHIKGKPTSVNEMFEKEKVFLRALPGYEFETAKCSSVRVSSFSTARFDTNDYSVPVCYCGSNVSVKGYAERVEIYYKGRMISSHERSFKRHTPTYTLEHYLPILERRRRAIFNAAPVRQNLPPEFLDWLKIHTADHKELMQLLWDCVDQGWENVWKNNVFTTEKPIVTDVVAVSPVNLSKYDLLASRKVGA